MQVEPVKQGFLAFSFFLQCRSDAQRRNHASELAFVFSVQDFVAIGLRAPILPHDSARFPSSRWWMTAGAAH
jgi:hypothetical protein